MWLIRGPLAHWLSGISRQTANTASEEMPGSVAVVLFTIPHLDENVAGGELKHNSEVIESSSRGAGTVHPH